jgi:hypothetical protein
MKYKILVIISLICIRGYSTFFDLPKELQLMVLTKAPTQDIINFCITSTTMLKLCNEEGALWVNLIERHLGTEWVPKGSNTPLDLKAAYLNMLGNIVVVDNNTAEDMDLWLTMNFRLGYYVIEPGLFRKHFNLKAGQKLSFALPKDAIETIKKSTDINEKNPLNVSISKVTNLGEDRSSAVQTNNYTFSSFKAFREFIARNDIKVME